MPDNNSNSGKSLPAALIFDMDGVLVDSNPFHLEKWSDLLRERGIAFNPEELPKLILGQRNDTALRHFFGPEMSGEERRKLSESLEETFRRAFKAHARALPGLDVLIAETRRAGIPMAVASSALGKNVDFVVDALALRSNFSYIVSGDEVEHAKPHPEIYLKAAKRLGIPPENCVAFEDSFFGIESAKCAGMKCVAIASTFPEDELRTQTRADFVAKGFEELTLETLRRLFPIP